MTIDRNDRSGFAPRHRALGSSTIMAELVATAALALSITVAATAVSIGIARANGLGAIATDGGARLAAVTVIGLLLAGLGGVTALAALRSVPAKQPK
jgi:hypothetical protein